jgi:hypothetical protein
MAIRDAVPLNFSATLPPLNAAGTFTSSPTLRLKGLVSLVVELNVSAVPGGTPTLDVFVQTSVDGGATWTDIIHFAPVTTTPGVQYAQVVGDLPTQTITGTSASPAGPFAQQDGTLPVNTTRQGPWGDLLRVKVVVGGTVTGQYIVAINGFVK